MSVAEETKLMRRVAGYHDLRWDGMSDLILRAKGLRCLDIGCNRGLVAFELANNGAQCVHGCDNYEEGIHTARQIFSDLRSVESRFEVVDLTVPGIMQQVFTNCEYDLVLMLATYHKIKRRMGADDLNDLMMDIGRRTRKFFGWRATSDKPNENEGEAFILDKLFKECDMRRVHTSYLSETLGMCAIWARR